jgi:hypothetical protein
MARFEYWMVYLPDVNPTSFVLFVFNQAEGSSKLRDYSSGHGHERGRAGVKEVFTRTRELLTSR